MCTAQLQGVPFTEISGSQTEIILTPNPWGHLAMANDIFYCHSLGMGRVEPRDILQCTGQRCPTPNNYLAQNAKSAEVEKP